MNLKERLLVEWLQIKGLQVFGAALYVDAEIYALVFNTPDLVGHYKLYSDKVPKYPDISGMNEDERARAFLAFYDDREEWVEFFQHVVTLSKNLRERLGLELMVSSPDNGVDMLIAECGIPAVLTACVPWVLEKDLVAAPPSNTVAAKPMTKEPPTPKQIGPFEPPAIGLPPVQRFNSELRSADVIDHKLAIVDELDPNFAGHVDPDAIKEVKE